MILSKERKKAPFNASDFRKRVFGIKRNEDTYSFVSDSSFRKMSDKEIQHRNEKRKTKNDNELTFGNIRKIEI